MHTGMQPVQYTRKILQFTRDFKPKTCEIKNDDGIVVWDSKGILDRWKTCCKWLHQDSGTPGINQLVPAVEVSAKDKPNILLDKIREVVYAMREHTALGCDGIEAELWQALGENWIKPVRQLCSAIWWSCKKPTEWCKSLLNNRSNSIRQQSHFYES